MDEPNHKYTTFKQRNPVGSFCRTFLLPEEWGNDKEIILHLAGAGPAAFIWIFRQNSQSINTSKKEKTF